MLPTPSPPATLRWQAPPFCILAPQILELGVLLPEPDAELEPTVEK